MVNFQVFQKLAKILLPWCVSLCHRSRWDSGSEYSYWVAMSVDKGQKVKLKEAFLWWYSDGNSNLCQNIMFSRKGLYLYLLCGGWLLYLIHSLLLASSFGKRSWSSDQWVCQQTCGVIVYHADKSIDVWFAPSQPMFGENQQHGRLE